MKSILEPYKEFILKSYKTEPNATKISKQLGVTQQTVSNFIRQYDSIPVLTFSNKKDVLNFFKCYKNLDFYLERKYNVFLSRINHPSYDKYK